MRGATSGGGQSFDASSLPSSSASGTGTPSRCQAYVSSAPVSASVARTEDSCAAPTSGEPVIGAADRSASARPRSSALATGSATKGSGTRGGTLVAGDETCADAAGAVRTQRTRGQPSATTTAAMRATPATGVLGRGP